MSGARVIFFVCALVIGITGMIGIRKSRSSLLVISAFLLPVLLFAALWCEIGLSDISLCFCLIAFLTLYGLRKEKK